MRARILIAIVVSIALCAVSFSLSEAYRSIKRKKDAGEKRVALVIGNGGYTSVSALDNPVNDANAMAGTLARCGFDVLKGVDMKRREMRDAVRRFVSQLRGAQVGLFFYAGHGLQVDGENYLVPLDADVQERFDVPDQCLEADYVLAAMEEARAGLNIVILDACRDNPFRSFRSSQGGLAFMNAPSGSFVAFSTSPGGVASDGQGLGNGLFTASLLRHLPTPGLRLTDVFMNVRNDVMRQSQGTQEPWVNQSIGRPFYFLAGGTPPARSGSLKVSTSPSGARIFVDNAPRGSTPQTMDDIQPGERVVRVEKQGYHTEERIARVQAGRTASLRIDLTPEKPKAARLYVDTEPRDATVKIMNIVPKFRQGMELDPGEPYEVRVEKNGYKTHNETVTLAQGEDLRMSVSLEKETSGPRAGDTWTEHVTGMEFVWVPGGCYQMGCGSWQSDCEDDEKPVHEVCVDGFWMGKYEVTQAQWKKIMGSNPSGFKGDDKPVEIVSWNDTQEFIKKLNNRSSGSPFSLPTEAEWEYACRSGGKPEKYCGGNNADRVAWYDDNSGDKTHPVGRKVPNGLGLYDMSGNVWEWCSDKYDWDYYSKSPRNNPTGPGGGSGRVIRGGSWYAGPGFVRSADRLRDIPDDAYSFIGFRLLRTAQ